MISSVWHRLDHGARHTLPVATTLLCCLFGVVAWPLPYLGTVSPPLALMAVYYWTIHRPDLFGTAAAFLIGLLNDLLNDLPPGLSAFLFVATHEIIYRQRRFIAGHSFFMTWSGFAATTLICFFLEWLMLQMIHWQGIPLLPIFMQAILAIVFFPLPCWLFIWLQRTALSQS